MKRIAYAVVALSLIASLASAQGAITDGEVSFGYTTFDVAGGAFADLEVDTGTDHMFGQWWYFRLMGDTAETIFPAPDSDTYVGNVATLTWADVNGLGFSATEVSTLTDLGDTAGGVRHDLTITNLSEDEPLVISIFNYTDLDMDASLGDDSANDLTATNLIVTETSSANFRGLGADAFQVTAFAVLRDELEDAGITDLNNSGTPFGPADFTGAFQWNFTTIPAGVSATFTTMHKVNDAAAPLEIAMAGGCPGPVQVRIAGATPGGSVAILASSALGSFTVPVGDCVGTELNLDMPSLLSTAPANSNGEITLTPTLPSSACGQVLQVLDLGNCGTSNADPIP